MKIFEPGEQEQAFIDMVVAEAERQSRDLTDQQRQRLMQLARQYGHLGEVAVTIVMDALWNTEALSRSRTQHLREHLHRQFFPHPAQADDAAPTIIEGEATGVSKRDEIGEGDDERQ